MSDITTLMMGAAGAGGEYEISRSLRFNSADSAYLNRTPASASNRKTWTISFWIKRAKLGSQEYILFAGSDSNNRTGIRWNNDNLEVEGQSSSATQIQLTTSAVYRDVSAWYHVVYSLDTTQATSSDRAKIYVNGTQVTAFGTATYPSQNADLFVNSTNAHDFGRYSPAPSNYLNGYLADINFIDGQALTPSSFGEVDSVTGVWKPIRYAGTYGTNGFHLDFSDNTSTTTLGYDAAGSNDWTPNNFSVTAGVGNDSLVDSPTQYGTDTGAGGEVRGNYATLNPLNNTATSLVNGNLDSGTASGVANWLPTSGTIGVSSGKWYWEVRMNSAEYLQVGIFPNTYAAVSGTYPGSASTSGYGYQSANGNKYVLGTGSAYGATFTTGDVIGVALDLDAGTLVFYKNGVSQGTAASSISGTFVPGIAVYNSTGASTVANCNFGQRPFAYTAPSGFKALCTTNLPDPTVVQGDDYFNTVLYTGTGSSLGVTGVGFQPDFVWIKERSGAADHGLYDAVRGVQKQLESNNTDAETTEATGLTAFGTDGFTVGALAQLNTSADTYVGWNWKANGAGVSNTDGTITSTVSANTTAGISIITYTGNGTAGATVGHGLGVVPKMVIIKRRDNTGWWLVFTDLTTQASGSVYTSSVFNIGDKSGGVLGLNVTNATFSYTMDGQTNASGGTYVALVFSEVEGFSKFGSYTGNGSTDGPFVYTGFRPAFVMFKRTDATSSWTIFDSKRTTHNVMGDRLYPDISNAEDNSTVCDFLSNGFKLRTTNVSYNASGGTYIYMAFSSNPFKTSLAR